MHSAFATVVLLLTGLAAAAAQEYPFLQPVTVLVRGVYYVDSHLDVVPLTRADWKSHARDPSRENGLAFFNQEPLPSPHMVEIEPITGIDGSARAVSAVVYADMQKEFELLRTTLYSRTSVRVSDNDTESIAFVGSVRQHTLFAVRNVNSTGSFHVVAEMSFDMVVGFVPSNVSTESEAMALEGVRVLLHACLGSNSSVESGPALVDVVCDMAREKRRNALGVNRTTTVFTPSIVALPRVSRHWMSHVLHKHNATVRNERTGPHVRFWDQRTISSPDEHNMHITHLHRFSRTSVESFRLATTEAAPGTPTSLPTYTARATNLWNLDRLDERSASTLNGQYSAVPNYSAEDPAAPFIYIVDSGVFVQHGEFQKEPGNSLSGSRASILYDAYPTQSPHWCNGHGTHVAGIAAGNNVGVNKGARIFSVRVLDCAGAGDFATIVAGLNSVIRHCPRDRPVVVNLSLSAPGSSSILLAALYNLRTACDAVIISAAGNTGDSPNVSPLACDQTPANSPDVITVAATALISSGSRSLDGMASFSSYGPCVDLAAPGGDIVSAFTTSVSSYKTMSGTSMASPLVAGVASLYCVLPAIITPRKAYNDVIRQRMLADATSNVISVSIRPNTVNLMAYVSPSVLSVWENAPTSS
eukprot:TRINITY_DN5048_c0_g2_i2.p1 TRINITY_DN5048_c0_g2~~TRINITY_DN5048_c0_g2_i2.p1  ORF type:complete len:643 (+),score=49.05 TRINITY_DN5048_c0_g2_i2:61-1989(+)